MMALRNWKLLLFVTAIVVFTGSSYADSNEDLKKLAKANLKLGLNLYKSFIKGTSGNIFFSPFSISTAFAILFEGTRGNTEKQLRSALEYESANLDSSKVPAAYNQYLELILPKNQSPNPAYTLKLANEILLAEDFNVYTQYKQQVQKFFHAIIKEVDFRKNSPQIIQDVNNWVSEQTNGKINQLLSSLSPSTVFLMINAIYFKGTWKTQFDKKDTKLGNFYNDGSNSKAKKVPLMHLTSNFPYASSNDLQALELPYKGENLSMIVLLPTKRNGLTSLENSLTLEKLLAMQKQMRTTYVAVTLPKFKIVYQRTLNSDFKALGATDVFNPEAANLSGITPRRDIYVNQVIHKAFVEVNEEGSEAAGATSIGGTATAVLEPAKFIADHPFIFIIVEKKYNVPLFVGRCTEL